MQDLLAVGFPGTHRAAEVLRELQSLDAKGVIDLADAVAVYRTRSGRLRVDRSVEVTKTQGARLGALVGAMLGSVIATPFAAGAGAAAAATAVSMGALGFGSAGAVAAGTDAEEWKAQYGVPEDFVRQTGGMVQPGHSAVFAMVRSDEDPIALARHFQGYGGTVLRTTLVSSKRERVQKVIGPRSEAPS